MLQIALLKITSLAISTGQNDVQLLISHEGNVQ